MDGTKNNFRRVNKQKDQAEYPEIVDFTPTSRRWREVILSLGLVWPASVQKQLLVDTLTRSVIAIRKKLHTRCAPSHGMGVFRPLISRYYRNCPLYRRSGRFHARVVNMLMVVSDSLLSHFVFTSCVNMLTTNLRVGLKNRWGVIQGCAK